MSGNILRICLALVIAASGLVRAQSIDAFFKNTFEQMLRNNPDFKAPLQKLRAEIQLKFLFRFLLTASLILPIAASAATITFDQNGNGNINGTPLSFTANGSNPNPPFQAPVLTYTLPFAGVQGDVELLNPISGIPESVIAFEGDGTVIYFASPAGNSSLANRYSPPIPPFPIANTTQVTEAADGSASYTPAAGEPGFDNSDPTYRFLGATSATDTPEPASFALLAIGGLAIFGNKLRKR